MPHAAAVGCDADVQAVGATATAPSASASAGAHHSSSRRGLVVIEADESQPLRQVAAARGGETSHRTVAVGLALTTIDPALGRQEDGEDGDRDDPSPSSDLGLVDREIARLLGVPIQGWVETLLVRPAFANGDGKGGGASVACPGLVACHLPPSRGQGPDIDALTSSSARPNVRATRLAMACGLLNLRLCGTVVLKTSTVPNRLRASDVEFAACVSPDLRRPADASWEAGGAGAAATTTIPEWLGCAAQHNYHDRAVIRRLASAMNRPPESDDDDEENDEEGDESGDNDDDDEGAGGGPAEGRGAQGSDSEDGLLRSGDANDDAEASASASLSTWVARVPLCLHCRRPASALCGGCQGAYFCQQPAKDGGREAPSSSSSPSCQAQGWSHRCWCETWRRYVSRRPELSSFAYLGTWVRDMTGRDCQLSQSAYETKLSALLGISDGGGNDDTADSASAAAAPAEPRLPLPLPRRSWWHAEFGAWKGGSNAHARHLHVLDRVSYKDGFGPLASELVPPERPLSGEDVARLQSDGGAVRTNSVGLLQLQSWADYYRLRGLPASSPAALLLTFPLTLYYAIVEYGQVPCTVAYSIMNRPLRIHVVGAEKELFFLDLFQETSFLLGAAGDADGNSTMRRRLELVFAVRSDMVPPSLRESVSRNGCTIVVSDALTVRLVSGTYGDPTSLDPNFDCSGGPPDMVLAFNAGLHAYESWRSVLEYLHENQSVVAVFTDYNEMSGSQSAALGGLQARDSLKVNPFRQPRAMPVVSMSLPQFGNGFVYAYNPQKLE